MRAETSRGRVVLWLGGPHRALSTLPAPAEVEAVAFAQVARDFQGDYLEYAEGVRRELGAPAVVFLTAAELPEAFSYAEEGPLALAATVAMTPPSCVGTINVAVVADAPLSRWGMADLLRTAVEAKCVAAVDSLLRCNGRRAGGTVTDAAAVLVPAGKPEEVHFAGPATELGAAASRLVYSLVRWGDKFDLFERVLVSRSEFIRIFRRVLEEAPLPVSDGEIAEALDGVLKDPNVWALILAAAELDALGAAGAIPGLAAEEYRADTARVVADELLGVALADYLGGFNAVLATYWVERLKKRGAIPELSMFSDDVLSALVAGVYLSLYRKKYSPS